MSWGRKCFQCGEDLDVENVWWWKKLQPRVSERKTICSPKFHYRTFLVFGQREWIDMPLWGRGGVSDSFCINLKSTISSEQWYHTLFSFFHISGDGNRLRAKKLKLKMSCGQNWLMVENSWWLKKLQPRMSLCGTSLCIFSWCWV